MAQMVKRTNYTNDEKDVLLNPDNAFQIGVQVANTGVSANSEGRKIIPAGTPVGGATSALKTRSTVLTVTNSSSTGANAQGILRQAIEIVTKASTLEAETNIKIAKELANSSISNQKYIEQLM